MPAISSHRSMLSAWILLGIWFSGTSTHAGLAEFAGRDRDATDALQALFDQGGTIRIPHGIFRFSQPLRITRSNVTVIGEPGAVLLLAPGKTNDGLKVGPPSDRQDAIGSVCDIRLVNLTIRNSPENYDWKRNTGTGIELWGVFGACVENCRVENFVHDGIAVRVCRDIQVRGCGVRGGRHGISLWGHYQNGKWGNRDIRVSDCRVVDAWDTGIAVGFFTDNAAITGCIIRNVRCHGIDIFNASDVTVSGNVVRDWLSSDFPDEKGRVAQAVGLFIHTDWGVPGAWRIPTRNIAVTGNTLVHGPFPRDRRPVCLEITGNVSAVSVAGNVVTGGQMALAMSGMQPSRTKVSRQEASGAKTPPFPREVVVTGNVFEGQTNLFWMGGALPEVHALIANNLFSPAPDAGVHLDRRLRGLVVSGNVFQAGRLPQAMPAGVIWRDNVTRMTGR